MSYRSKHVLVTDPYLFPISYAKRLTPAQYAKFKQTYAEDLEWEFCSFSVAPYTQKLQRELRSRPEYMAEFAYGV